MSTHHASTSRQTDVRKRTVLPTTLQNLRSNDNNHNSQSGGGGGEFDTLSSDAYLDKLEEELNRKVDGEVEGLVQGLKDLIALARVSSLPSLFVVCCCSAKGMSVVKVISGQNGNLLDGFFPLPFLSLSLSFSSLYRSLLLHDLDAITRHYPLSYCLLTCSTGKWASLDTRSLLLD
jgi:hypothetical protein